MFKFVIFGLLVAAASALPTQDVNQATGLDCLEEEALFSCLAIKASSALNRAARSSNIEVFEGVTFVRDIPMERSGKALNSENEVEMLNELPREASDRTMKLMSMLYDGVVSFLKSHSLKVNMPEESISRALVEGRGKIKKLLLPLIAAAGLKIFALVPILFGGLGLLVLKAVFVSKIALLLAGILAFQKLFGGSNVASSAGNFFSKGPQASSGPWVDSNASQGWSNGGAQQSQQGYYKRSLDDVKTDAQSIAYSSYVPNTAS